MHKTAESKDLPRNSLASARFAEALHRWRKTLGPEHVVTTDEEVAKANAATFSPSGEVVAIIQPSSTVEVQECLRISQECRVPIHVVSRGRNWGYGSRTPPLGAAVLMELRRMNTILEFNQELAYVRVQPGVTFDQLSQYLENHGSGLQMDATSGPRDGSVVGNALERGRSHGPAMATARAVGDFQVVLPDGRLIHTSTRRFPGAAHAPSEPFPLGGDSTGLFFESNLGVVTEMTIALTRTAREARVLFLAVRDDESMLRLVAPIRELMMDGVLLPQSALLINGYRRRAEAQIDERGRTETSMTQDSGRVQGIPGLPRWPQEDFAWLCNVTVYATDAVIADRRFELVRAALTPHAVAVHEGRPTNVGARPNPEPMRIPYSKKGRVAPPTPDLDGDRIGYIFMAPVAPALRDDISKVYELLCDGLLEYGFEPFVNLRFWDSRSVVFVGSIIYDRDEPDADERAQRCYIAILNALAAAGYFPYRMPTFAMQKLPVPLDDWASFWADIKRALDPSDVLSRGRYDFRDCWPSSPA